MPPTTPHEHPPHLIAWICAWGIMVARQWLLGSGKGSWAADGRVTRGRACKGVMEAVMVAAAAAAVMAEATGAVATAAATVALAEACTHVRLERAVSSVQRVGSLRQRGVHGRCARAKAHLKDEHVAVAKLAEDRDEVTPARRRTWLAWESNPGRTSAEP